MIFDPLPHFVFPMQAPAILGRRETAVNESLAQVKVALMMECLSEDLEHVLQDTAPNPLLKAPMAGLVRRIALGKVSARSPSAQDPEYSVEHCAVLPPGATATVLAAPQCR